MTQTKYDFGMVGLGVMGRNLLLNISDHGFSIAGLDLDAKKVEQLKTEAAGRVVNATTEMKAFINMLETPRRIMLLVPAGKPVDAVLKSALPFLEAGDVVIDGGNSHFIDTDRRLSELKDTGIQFMGMGVSGGEEGARYGPSIMPGGTADGYKKLQPILEAIAAKVNGDPCVTHVGTGSAGHYTKMVHNGIEYGLMQVIAETYDIMKRGLGMANEEMQKVYAAWNEDVLQSFLMEITAKILSYKDKVTHKGLLLDYILDAAAQKGTGMWTSQSAMDLKIPLPVIDLAVSMRDLTALKDERMLAAKKYPPQPSDAVDPSVKEKIVKQLKDAAYFASIAIYAQGMHLLKVASDQMNYGITLKDVARIWRGGCIIRSSMLEQIMTTYSKEATLTNMMTDESFSGALVRMRPSLENVCVFAMSRQLPAPALGAAISYVDAYRSAWLPANLIQAQRDFFGSHTYQRIDTPGTFHTNWQKA